MRPLTTSARDSLWLSTAPESDYPSLEGDRETDVVVLGGGIAGLTTALLLKRQGARVEVIEAHRVGSGVTGCTTAKVSALQSTIYSTIRGRNGKDAAAAYAEASLTAVGQVAELVQDLGIDCDLTRRSAFTYAATPEESSSIEDEYEAAAEAGLRVRLVDSPDVPYLVHGAVRLDDQLVLHPVRYVQGLAAAIDGGGSRAFERTRATGLDEGSPCAVETTGGTVRADQVV